MMCAKGIIENIKFLCCRATRRQSLSEIGFGRIDTYTKLDKLGEVRYRCVEYVGGGVGDDFGGGRSCLIGTYTKLDY